MDIKPNGSSALIMGNTGRFGEVPAVIIRSGLYPLSMSGNVVHFYFIGTDIFTDRTPEGCT
ncbi:MAG: hypothetical protein V1681_06565, partial [Candidatus Neomarinimicrobiota bacterium]